MVDIKVNGQTYSGVTTVEVEKADGTGNVVLSQVSGNTTITSNGTYNVAQYENAIVNVQEDSPILVTKSVTSNGTYNASSDNADGYSQVTVAVPEPNYKYLTYTADSDTIAVIPIQLTSADTTIAAHRNDASMVVCLQHSNAGFESKTSVQMMCVGNRAYNTMYGTMLRSSSESVVGIGITESLNDGGTTAATLKVNTDGSVTYNNSSQYPLRAGTYSITVTW